MVLEKTLKGHLDSKEIKSVNLKEISPEYLTDAEAETPILFPPDGKNWLTGKDPNSGKNWRQAEKGMTEDEMFGWYYWLDGHEIEQTWEIDDWQGSLECCSPWGHKELDMTDQLNWTEQWSDWSYFLQGALRKGSLGYEKHRILVSR